MCIDSLLLFIYTKSIFSTKSAFWGLEELVVWKKNVTDFSISFVFDILFLKELFIINTLVV